MGELIASHKESTPGDGTADTGWMPGALGGFTSQETGGTAFMVEEGPLGLRGRINGVLTAVVHALTAAVVMHDLWLSSSLFMPE